MLTSLVGARFAVEVGTFTGYSALSDRQRPRRRWAPLCCDVSTEWTDIARTWALAGVDDRIDLRVASVIETLARCPATPSSTSRSSTPTRAATSTTTRNSSPVAPHGLICVDNTLWSGAVVDPEVHDANTEAIRRFNDHVAADVRTRQVIVPIGDGLTLIRHA